MEAKEGKWAELPRELLHLIVKKLPDICDFIRSRAICKPWRVSISFSDLPLQFPWILKLSKGPDLEFYSFDSNKIYTIHASISSDKELFGPARGYILARQLCNKDHFSLLNPFNNSEFCLPVLDGTQIYVSSIGTQSFQNDDYVLVTDHMYKLAIYKPGNDKWNYIGVNLGSKHFYFKSLLFKVDLKTGVTKVMDIDSRKELYVIPAPKKDKKLTKPCRSIPFLVESCGEILRVRYSRSDQLADYEFDIHRLEFGNGEGYPCWVKIRSIGDRILFFDFAACGGFSLRANDFAGFKGNCIYFIRKLDQVSGGLDVCVIYMYDIENGNTGLIDCPFNNKNDFTWFMPTFNHI